MLVRQDFLLLIRSHLRRECLTFFETVRLACLKRQFMEQRNQLVRAWQYLGLAVWVGEVMKILLRKKRREMSDEQ